LLFAYAFDALLTFVAPNPIRSDSGPIPGRLQHQSILGSTDWFYLQFPDTNEVAMIATSAGVTLETAADVVLAERCALVFMSRPREHLPSRQTRAYGASARRRSSGRRIPRRKPTTIANPGSLAVAGPARDLLEPGVRRLQRERSLELNSCVIELTVDRQYSTEQVERRWIIWRQRDRLPGVHDGLVARVVIEERGREIAVRVRVSRLEIHRATKRRNRFDELAGRRQGDASLLNAPASSGRT